MDLTARLVHQNDTFNPNKPPKTVVPAWPNWPLKDASAETLGLSSTLTPPVAVPQSVPRSIAGMK